MPVMAEFYRLCEHMHWTRRYRGLVFGGPTTSIEDEEQQKVKDEERQKAKEGIQSAIAKTFNDTYGVDRHDLRSWQKLCRALRLDPIPTTLNDCHDHIRATHVNICNLIDVPRTGEPPKLFESEKALSEYTKRTGEYFPQGHAEAGGILRFLLRYIENPREGPEGRSRGKCRSWSP
ncbi:uncharacterized protein STEHIDRAFT_104178 [Stereum hirsutum FP-91666 SS1]|uniref:uncharacterized protein n=1 Tax=Stereum hirsutum (strain FP-91666) TaxID=721885 RepID=UPI000444951D|nr:uncharacterized protein STEHIDRAFT_104178 [Stereum hirsutum FP-91666 SS1]EIM81673.1 hypothetical protein STEHIDRAFT_104178 [Stereum hirsutum FP-91666 SS1]